MPKIEKLLQMIVERNVNQVLLMSDKPFQIFSNGSITEGQVTPAAQLLDLMEEVVPASFIPNLRSGGKFQFDYMSAVGEFRFGVDNLAGIMQVNITPTRKPIPQPQVAPAPLRPAVAPMPLQPVAGVVRPPLAPEEPQPINTIRRELYIAQNGQSIGPMSPEAAQHGVQSGHYMLHDMAIAPHLQNWDSLQNVLDYYNATPTSVVSQGALTAAPGKGHRSNLIRSFLNEEQDPEAVAKVVDRLQEICTPDETILYIAVQKKLVFNVGCEAAVLTSKRVIIFRPSTFGFGLNFEDFPWWKVADTHISEALFGSTFSVKLTNGAEYMVDSLPKAQARKLYQFGQQKEEHMHRYRREQLLEEKRAGASNISMVNNNGPANQTAAPPPIPIPATPAIQEGAEDPVAKLQKLKTMLEMSLISQAEYDSKRAEIISRL